jgi:hypothetical protein
VELAEQVKKEIWDLHNELDAAGRASNEESQQELEEACEKLTEEPTRLREEENKLLEDLSEYLINCSELCDYIRNYLICRSPVCSPTTAT